MLPSKHTAGKPAASCPYSRMIQRRYAWLRRVADVLHGLQNHVDRLDADFDPTAYFTDPDESRLIVLDEILAEAGFLLHDGEPEEADDTLRRAEQAAEEAFAVIVDDGIALCEAETGLEKTR